MAGRAKKPSQSLAGVRRRAEEEADALGLELVDVVMARESTGSVLRFTIDKNAEGGVSLDDCENFHRRALKYAQDIDYDYMEVTSPGADRPLKRDCDFERALGQTVEARFYRQMDGVKQLRGKLAAFDAETVTLDDDEMDSPLFDQLERETEGADNNDHEKDHDGGKSGT